MSQQGFGIIHIDMLVWIFEGYGTIWSSGAIWSSSEIFKSIILRDVPGLTCIDRKDSYNDAVIHMVCQ